MAAKTHRRTVSSIGATWPVVLVALLVACSAAFFAGFFPAARAASAQPSTPSIEVTPSWTLDGLAHLAPAVTAAVSGVPQCSSQEFLDPGDGRIVAAVDGQQVYPPQSDTGAEFSEPDSAVFHANLDTIVAVLAWPAGESSAELTITCAPNDGSPDVVVATNYTRSPGTAPFSVPIPVADGIVGVIYHVEIDLAEGRTPADVSTFTATFDGVPIDLQPDSRDLIEPYLAATVPLGADPGLHLVEVSDGERSATFPVVNGISPDAYAGPTPAQSPDDETLLPDTTTESGVDDPTPGPSSNSDQAAASVGGTDSVVAGAADDQAVVGDGPGNNPPISSSATAETQSGVPSSLLTQLLLVGGLGAMVTAAVSWAVIRRS